jgi:hypothetical protein
LIESHNWEADKGYKARSRVFSNIVRYLSSQTQDALPYTIPNVNSNDQIFIGNEEFRKEANSCANYCFNKLLEYVEALNGIKMSHPQEFFYLLMTCANVITSVGELSIKQMSAVCNKFFKMSDQFLTEYNGKPEVKSDPSKQLNRNYINKTFDCFRRKREEALANANLRASTA